MHYPPSIKKLIDQFSKFPTVGPRTAARFVFYLISSPKDDIDNLLRSVEELKKTIKICQFCFSPFEGKDSDLCETCTDNSRDKSLLCVIEKETDLFVMRKINKYKGYYFILGETIGARKTASLIENLRIKELEERIKNPSNFGLENTSFKEIILATNPTPDGEAAGLYVERTLKPLGIKITRLGRGLPVGGELEYADEETLNSALENRK